MSDDNTKDLGKDNRLSLADIKAIIEKKKKDEDAKYYTTEELEKRTQYLLLITMLNGFPKDIADHIIEDYKETFEPLGELIDLISGEAEDMNYDPQVLDFLAYDKLIDVKRFSEEYLENLESPKKYVDFFQGYDLGFAVAMLQFKKVCNVLKHAIKEGGLRKRKKQTENATEARKNDEKTFLLLQELEKYMQKVEDTWHPFDEMGTKEGKRAAISMERATDTVYRNNTNAINEILKKHGFKGEDNLKNRFGLAFEKYTLLYTSNSGNGETRNGYKPQSRLPRVKKDADNCHEDNEPNQALWIMDILKTFHEENKPYFGKKKDE